MQRTIRWIRHNAGAAVIIAIAAVVIAAAAWNQSLTYDEVTYISSGYSYMTQGDMRLNPEHPPLFKDMAALPLLFMDINQGAFSTPSWTANTNDQWEFAKEFLFRSGNDATRLTHAARLPMLFFFVVAAASIFAWARERYGVPTAYLALIIFGFSPTIMAHSGLVVNDIAAASGVLAGMLGFAYFIRHPTWTRAFIAGLLLGFALLTKFSTILLIPLFLGITLIYTIYCWSDNSASSRTRLRAGFIGIAKFLFIAATAFIIIVYPVYAAHVRNYPPERQQSDAVAIITKADVLPAELLGQLAGMPVVRPLAHFALGIGMNVARSAAGNTFYFNGSVGTEASPLYFPFAYALKEPLPWLILLGVGIFGAVFVIARRMVRQPRQAIQKIFAVDTAQFLKKHSDEIIMVTWIAGYGVLSIFGNLNIGIRHILPLYPFIIMLGSALCMWTIRIIRAHSSRYGRIAYITAALLILWYMIESLVAFPFYLPYFNQIAGGSDNGGAYFTDSNLDWGQDVGRLGQWLEANNVRRIEGDIFTSSELSYHLGDRFIPLWRKKYASAEEFMQNSETQWLAISEGTLRDAWARGDGYAWLQEYEPETVIGHSIRVYHLPRQ